MKVLLRERSLLITAMFAISTDTTSLGHILPRHIGVKVAGFESGRRLLDVVSGGTRARWSRDKCS